MSSISQVVLRPNAIAFKFKTGYFSRTYSISKSAVWLKTDRLMCLLIKQKIIYYYDEIEKYILHHEKIKF